MSVISTEFEDFFSLNQPAGDFEFMDYQYLYSFTSPREIDALIRELVS